MHRIKNAIIMCCLLVCTGCLAFGGSARYDSQYPTLGKQLTDLKAARDSGAINDAEYLQARQRLLNGPRP